MTRTAPLPHVLGSITRLVESAGVGTLAAVSVLEESGRAFAYMIAPELPAGLRTALARASVDIRNGSCAAAVYLGRQVLVADVGADPCWLEPRAAALGAGLKAAWSTPIKAAGGKVLGSLGVFRAEPGLPSPAESQVMARAAQLAGIAIERRLAEEALRSSEAKFRGLFESIAEGVYQSGCDGRLLSVNRAFASILGYASPEELCALAEATRALLGSGRPRRVHAARGVGRRDPRRRVPHAPPRRPADRGAGECAPDARQRQPHHRLRGHDCRDHRAQARRAGGVRRERARAGHAAVDRRCGDHHRCRRLHRVHQSGGRAAHRLEPRRRRAVSRSARCCVCSTSAPASRSRTPSPAPWGAGRSARRAISRC